FKGQNGTISGVSPSHNEAPRGTAAPEQRPQLTAKGFGSRNLTPKQLEAQARQLEAQAKQQHSSVLHQLLIQSGIALAAMALARQRTLGQVALADPDATIGSLRHAHQRVLAAGAEQERLIDALLALARGQTGLATREPVDLATLAERVLVAQQPEAEREELEI